MFRPQPLHQLPSLGIGGDASAASFLPGCGGLLLDAAGIWHTLGNRLAIAWQSRGNTMAIGPFFWQSPFSVTVGILKRMRFC